MSIADTAAATIARPLLPWILLAICGACAASGAAGLYGGIEIATARYAKAQDAIQNAYADSLQSKNDALVASVKNSNTVTGELIGRLDNLRIVNTTVHAKVVKETEKLVYTDCKVPASGIDVLQQHIDAVNLRLVGGGKK
jgi:hypothetical protein